MCVTEPQGRHCSLVSSVPTQFGAQGEAADPVEWTVTDVVEYFTEAGFPEQATAFQEQVGSALNLAPGFQGLSGDVF